MKRRLIVRHGRKMAVAFCGLLMGASLLQSCTDDLLTGQPEWLGNSIYERLQNDTEGQSYTTLLRLVDDLGQTEVLSHTGSKTIFAADDAAFRRWFKNNSWGVRSYSQLTTAQKKLLLNSAMVNNAYLIELLSNASGNPPTKGASMRRTTALTIYDSVPQIMPEEMPLTQAWDEVREKGKSLKIFKDVSARPIFHLLPEFMRVNGFTSDDVRKLTNGKSGSVDSSWINGVRVTKENITCKNGYIHKVADVIMPVDNMAEILRTHSDMSRWSQLIDRFSAPYYRAAESREYNRLYNRDNDSVYTLQYFSNISYGGKALELLPDGKTAANATLIFDPGWNQYMYTNPQNHDLHYDAAAMLVPSDVALEDWWMNKGGKALRDQYEVWDSVPDDVLADLLNNNMLDAFINTIPSKFSSIVDDAQVRMNVQPSDVDSSFVGCNGVVYLTNKVFAPSFFSSVAFPAKIRKETMDVINWAIENVNGGVYKSLLSSMEATYSLLIPTNASMLTYVDPTLYGSNRQMLYQFYYDYSKSTLISERVKVRRYQLTKEGDMLVRSVSPLALEAERTLINNRLEDLLNSMIIVGELNPAQEYYKTRAGSVVRIRNIDQAGVMTVEGGYQMDATSPAIMTPDSAMLEVNTPAIISSIYDMTKEANGGIGNGKSYEISNYLPMTSTHSLISILKETPEFEEFYHLVADLNNLNFKQSTQAIVAGSSDMTAYPTNSSYPNFGLFDGYNYTVYVPNNEVIQSLQEKGYLPKTSDYSDAIKSTGIQKWGSRANAQIAQQVILERIGNFVRYHVQDNSVIVNGPTCNDNSFESSMVNPANNRFYALHVTNNSSGMRVNGRYALDESGNVVKAVDDSESSIAAYGIEVDVQSGVYNKLVRELWNRGLSSTGGSGNDTNKIIYSSSDAVVHLLKNGALFFDPSQLTSWEEEAMRRIQEANANAN